MKPSVHSDLFENQRAVFMGEARISEWTTGDPLTAPLVPWLRKMLDDARAEATEAVAAWVENNAEVIGQQPVADTAWMIRKGHHQAASPQS